MTPGGHGLPRPPRPQRVRITSPRMGTVARPDRSSPTREIDEQTGLGEVYMRSLLRTQLRLGLTAVGVLALILGTLPLLFAEQPQLADVRLLGLPLTWVVVAAGLYPVIIATAWWLDRAANRVERDFAEIVTRS